MVGVMGRELLASEPVFRAVAEDCDARFKAIAGWSILDEMRAAEILGGCVKTGSPNPRTLFFRWRSEPFSQIEVSFRFCNHRP